AMPCSWRRPSPGPGTRCAWPPPCATPAWPGTRPSGPGASPDASTRSHRARRRGWWAVGDPPVALTIAGSDSAAGAGIQADLKTMAALGVFGTTAVTAVTAQNTARVIAVHPVPPEIVDAQIGAVVEDLAV